MNSTTSTTATTTPATSGRSPAARSFRPAAVATALGAVCAAAAGALQATGLDWNESTVETGPQHVAMALMAAGLVLTVPGVLGLGRLATRRLRHAAAAVAVGHLSIATAMTISNVRGEDASWFDAVAVTGNLVWLVGSIALAVGCFRSRRLPRPVAVGLVFAYLATIPLGTLGGGILAGCYWLAVALLVLSDEEREAATGVAIG